MDLKVLPQNFQRVMGGYMDAKNDNVTSVELQDELSNRILQIRFVASTNRLLELLKEKSESKAKGIDFEDVKLNI